MVFATAFNIAEFALWTGIVSTMVSIFTIVYMFLLRVWRETERKRSEEVTKKWEETIHDVILGVKNEEEKPTQEVYKLSAEDKRNFLQVYIEKGRFDPVEPLSKVDLPHFLYLWNYLHESLRGNSKDQLNTLAQTLAVDESTYKMLKSRSLKKRILAINTFGNLRDREAYGEIRKLIDERDPIISLWAWRALLRIDLQETLENHFTMIADRADWSPIFVAKVLLEQDRDVLSEPLVALVEKCYENKLAERQMARLVSYLTITHISSYAPLINRILAESDQTEVIIACLRLVKTDDALGKVRELLKSERWEIRLQVVQTLGRLGHEEDIEHLISALNDLDWWVRYRAAQALYVMPMMTTRKFAHLAKTLPNEFSRDMLNQVLAEERLSCFNQTPPSLLSR